MAANSLAAPGMKLIACAHDHHWNPVVFLGFALDFAGAALRAVRLRRAVRPEERHALHHRIFCHPGDTDQRRDEGGGVPAVQDAVPAEAGGGTRANAGQLIPRAMVRGNRRHL